MAAGKLSWGLEAGGYKVLAIQLDGHLTFMLRWVSNRLTVTELLNLVPLLWLECVVRVRRRTDSSSSWSSS